MIGRVILPVEAVLFDLGGVLVEIDFERILAHWAKSGGVPLAAVRERFRLDDAYERQERGDLDLRAYFETLRQSLGLAISDDDFRAGWDAIFVREVPGMRALLRDLEPRAPLYVFSNTNPSHHQTWGREYAELLRPFRKVFVSCELGLRKPAPEAFHAVAQAIDIPPERILFFDDTPANVAGALAIGMQAVHVGSIGDVENAVRNVHWSTHKENIR